MKWLLYALLAGLAVWGYQTFVDRQQTIGEQRATARYELALSNQKAAAADLLAAETARANEAERRARELLAEQEKRDAKNVNTVAGLQARLRALAGPAGQLRDPNAQPGRGCGSGGAIGAPAADPGSRPPDKSEAGGLLSAELSGLLQRLTFEADAINVAYASCRSTLTAERLPPN